MTQKNGHMAVEATHEGIPDDDLKPEAFSQTQLDVLVQLDPDTQEKIRQGYPIVIGDLTTGNSISFNLHNVRPSKYQLEGFARAILPTFRILSGTPDLGNLSEFQKGYEKWRAEHRPATSKQRKGRKSSKKISE